MKKALGLIEAIGLATAIEATDAAVKSANVELLGMEPCKGDGMYAIKVVGDVGAVKAACDAASIACSKGRGCFSIKVIARPSEGLLPLIYNAETLGYKVPEVVADIEEKTVVAGNEEILPPEEITEE